MPSISSSAEIKIVRLPAERTVVPASDVSVTPFPLRCRLPSKTITSNPNFLKVDAAMLAFSFCAVATLNANAFLPISTYMRPSFRTRLSKSARVSLVSTLPRPEAPVLFVPKTFFRSISLILLPTLSRKPPSPLVSSLPNLPGLSVSTLEEFPSLVPLYLTSCTVFSVATVFW